MNNYVRIEEELERQSKSLRVVESLVEKQAVAKIDQERQRRDEGKACWVDWRPLPASDGRL